MEHLKRNIFILLFIIVIGSIGYLIFYKTPMETKPTPVLDGNLPTTSYPAANGITLTYPIELTLTDTDGVITLHHEVPYRHTNPCDMTGNETTLDTFTDFHVTIRLIDKSVAKAAQQINPSITEENIDGDTLTPSPGHIYTSESIGFKGFLVLDEVEGCGVTTHYFPVSNNRTLMIQQQSIALFSEVRGEEEIQKVLLVPGVISPEKAQDIFTNILQSILIK